MRPLNRSGTGHDTLVLMELAAVPVAVLVTVFTLALAELVAAVVGVTNDAVAAGDLVPTVGNAAVGFGTLLLLVSGGGFLVVGYRRCFESRFDDVDPLSVVLVPILGIVVPIGYAFVATDSLGLSSWLFLPVAVSAHALAYRTIAIDSFREDRGRTSFVVGALTALPAVAVLVDVASGILGSERPIARTLDAVVASPDSPMVRAVLIAVPLLVTVCYGVGTLYRKQSLWDGPEWSMPRPRLEWPASRPRPGRSISRLRASIADRLSRDRTDPSGRQPAGAGTARASSESNRRARTPSDVVPSSPGSASAGRRTSNDSDDSDYSDDSDDAKSSDEATADSSPAGDRAAGDRREDAIAADASPAAETGAAADSTADGGASDTRIFVDDFDQYVPDESPVERCPDCDQEIPSDGVYNFCPFCGGEL